ncbi:hypothetical protein M6B38_270730 [Iris pallida]|uniref:Uncharacterized protein n=1 Tax=Iris pallida TaxID=29817 RepID=A0AAX6I820_IRIPA|nr:hypothetical protein M6B38_270730 [Iris pallida]
MLYFIFGFIAPAISFRHRPVGSLSLTLTLGRFEQAFTFSPRFQQLSL